MSDYTIHHGDCLETLRKKPDNSVDAVVTDPPYGLSKEPDVSEVLRHWLAGDDYTHTGGGFMGKSWDSFVPGPSVWREALRVLKPGGHALVFAGSRTQDLMTTALRLGGFQIRDTAMWFYSTGFPKSLDVSKAVDAADAIGPRRQRALQFTAWMRSTGITARQINEATGSNMGSHYLTDKEQPAVATLDMFALMAHLLPEPPPEIMQLMEWRTVESENLKRREVIETRHDSTVRNVAMISGKGDYTITTAHTEEAKKWEGWGTALKPGYEPIIICRKPLDGTIADTVLKHGTGAINVDGCRAPSDEVTGWGGNAGLGYHGGTDPNGGNPRPVLGRWPANVLHDGCLSKESWGRYFYCAKASKADRNEGLEHLEARSAGEVTGGRAEGSDGLNSPRAGAGRTSGARNHHPTVKPTELMRWCVRLVTPSGGVVLDPFAGSGSTGKAALLEGFKAVLCEREAEYIPLIEARCAWAMWQSLE